MNNIVFEEFLKEQVLMQRELFLENRDLTESQKYNKVVSILRENNKIDEGMLDRLGSLVSGGVGKVKRFIIRRMLAFMGIPANHPLSAPFTKAVDSLSLEEFQGLVSGKERQIKLFAEVATLATIRTFTEQMEDIFKLKRNTTLGGAVIESLEKAVNSREFAKLIRKGYYDTFTEVKSIGWDEDPDGDGLTNAEEEIIGTDSAVEDDNESLKDLINDEPVEEPFPTDTEEEYGDLGPPEDTGEELEGDLSGWDPRVEDWMIGWYNPKEPDEFVKSRLFSREEAKETLQDWSDKNPDLRFWVLLASDENDT